MVPKNLKEHPLVAQYKIFASSRKELNLTDAVTIRKFTNEIKLSDVMHAAGRTGGIKPNIANQVYYLMTNVDLGRKVIIAAYQASVTKLKNVAALLCS